MKFPDDYLIPGIEPYHVEDAGIIYCADCRDIFPHLPPVDLVLTDPPYGIDYQSSRRIDWQRKEKIVGDREFPNWIFELIKYNIALFVWCRWDNLIALPKPKSFIVWDKGKHSMGDLKHEFGRQYEGCAFYPGKHHAFTKRPQDVIRSKSIPPDRLIHPAEKPVPVYKYLINHHPGDVVLDPFLGSGTTAVAAKELGRKFIGIEIDDKYCKIAVKRLRQGVLNFE